VGERNLYSLHPRGRILLRAESVQGLYRQIAAVLAGGCDGVVQGIAIPSDLPAPVAARLSVHAGGDLAGLLVEGDAAAVLQAQQDMAARPGAIVPVHVALQGGNGPAYDLDRLVEEVSISINTTAAGAMPA
jgi:RHH-type proline utilization regulon transcriptional repressor/proline dehydrogenase/delta 1-pyrroline-5-carboxylate dehydrogenase